MVSTPCGCDSLASRGGYIKVPECPPPCQQVEFFVGSQKRSAAKLKAAPNVTITYDMQTMEAVQDEWSDSVLQVVCDCAGLGGLWIGLSVYEFFAQVLHTSANVRRVQQKRRAERSQLADDVVHDRVQSGILRNVEVTVFVSV